MVVVTVVGVVEIILILDKWYRFHAFDWSRSFRWKRRRCCCWFGVSSLHWDHNHILPNSRIFRHWWIAQYSVSRSVLDIKKGTNGISDMLQNFNRIKSNDRHNYIHIPLVFVVPTVYHHHGEYNPWNHTLVSWWWLWQLLLLRSSSSFRYFVVVWPHCWRWTCPLIIEISLGNGDLKSRKFSSEWQMLWSVV